MRLVIEREGGFDIIEDSETITAIDVESASVVVTFGRVPDESTKHYYVGDHAAACRLSAAIAVKCGVLVEPLAEQPEIDGEEAMGAASAALVRKHTRPWKPAIEWVNGEPPKDGRWYVVVHATSTSAHIVRWAGASWRGEFVADWEEFTPVAHLPTPIPKRG